MSPSVRRLPPRTIIAGLPKAAFPLLVAAGPKLLVAATQLSHCRIRRFAPTDRWIAVTERILAFASGGQWGRERAAAAPLWTASVTASFSRDEPLPPGAELQALQRGVQFYRNAKLMPDAKRATDLGMLVPSLPDFDQRVSE
jgi:hypothetical protein